MAMVDSTPASSGGFFKSTRRFLRAATSSNSLGSSHTSAPQRRPTIPSIYQSPAVTEDGVLSPTPSIPTTRSASAYNPSQSIGFSPSSSRPPSRIPSASALHNSRTAPAEPRTPRSPNSSTFSYYETDSDRRQSVASSSYTVQTTPRQDRPRPRSPPSMYASFDVAPPKKAKPNPLLQTRSEVIARKHTSGKQQDIKKAKEALPPLINFGKLRRSMSASKGKGKAIGNAPISPQASVAGNLAGLRGRSLSIDDSWTRISSVSSSVDSTTRRKLSAPSLSPSSSRDHVPALPSSSTSASQSSSSISSSRLHQNSVPIPQRKRVSTIPESPTAESSAARPSTDSSWTKISSSPDTYIRRPPSPNTLRIRRAEKLSRAYGMQADASPSTDFTLSTSLSSGPRISVTDDGVADDGAAESPIVFSPPTPITIANTPGQESLDPYDDTGVPGVEEYGLDLSPDAPPRAFDPTPPVSAVQETPSLRLEIAPPSSPVKRQPPAPLHLDFRVSVITTSSGGDAQVLSIPSPDQEFDQPLRSPSAPPTLEHLSWQSNHDDQAMDSGLTVGDWQGHQMTRSRSVNSIRPRPRAMYFLDSPNLDASSDSKLVADGRLRGPRPLPARSASFNAMTVSAVTATITTGTTPANSIPSTPGSETSSVPQVLLTPVAPPSPSSLIPPSTRIPQTIPRIRRIRDANAAAPPSPSPWSTNLVPLDLEGPSNSHSHSEVLGTGTEQRAARHEVNWSGEWNRRDMQDVIKSLRELK